MYLTLQYIHCTPHQTLHWIVLHYLSVRGFWTSLWALLVVICDWRCQWPTTDATKTIGHRDSCCPGQKKTKKWRLLAKNGFGLLRNGPSRFGDAELHLGCFWAFHRSSVSNWHDTMARMPIFDVSSTGYHMQDNYEPGHFKAHSMSWFKTEPKDSWESKPAVATRPCPLGKHRCLTGLGPPNISRVRHARSKLSLSRACGIRTMSPLSLRMILSMRWSTWTPPVWIFGTCVRSTCPEPRAAITQMILCFFTLEFSVATSSRASDRRLKLGCLSEKRHLPMCSFEPHGRPVCSASARPSPETNNVAWPKSFSHSLSLSCSDLGCDLRR